MPANSLSDLPLFERPGHVSNVPTATLESIARFKAHLMGNGWQKSTSIPFAITGCETMPTHQRALKKLAQETRPDIISGNKGYCLLSESTLEDQKEFLGRIKSQMQTMQKTLELTQSAIAKQTAVSAFV